jgi:hypothetical protein
MTDRRLQPDVLTRHASRTAAPVKIERQATLGEIPETCTVTFPRTDDAPATVTGTAVGVIDGQIVSRRTLIVSLPDEITRAIEAAVGAAMVAPEPEPEGVTPDV